VSQKARLGSLEYVASSEPSSSEAAKIREAAGNSVYSKELVRAALSVNKKVILLLNRSFVKTFVCLPVCNQQAVNSSVYP